MLNQICSNLNRSVVGLLLVFIAPATFAFQPLNTDDTGTQGDGGNQFEFSASENRSNSTGVTTRTRTLPVVYTRGLSDTVDIFIGANHTRIRSNNSTLDASGGGNPSIGAKWRYYENEESKTSLAIKPEIVIPVSVARENEKLGTGRTSYKLTLIMTQEVSFGAVHANLLGGRNRYRDSATPDESILRASVAPVFDVAEQWKLALDVGAERKRTNSTSTRSNFAEIGTIYSYTKDSDFALGVIRTTDNAQPSTGTTFVTLGGTWRFK